EKLLALDVPQRESEHTSEARNAFSPPFYISVEYDFRIGVAGKLMPSPEEFLPDLAEVINLAVECHHRRAIGVRHRLPASGRKIDDGQSPVAKPDTVFLTYEIAGVIGPSARQRGGHRAQVGFN